MKTNWQLQNLAIEQHDFSMTALIIVSFAFSFLSFFSALLERHLCLALLRISRQLRYVLYFFVSTPKSSLEVYGVSNHRGRVNLNHCRPMNKFYPSHQEQELMNLY